MQEHKQGLNLYITIQSEEVMIKSAMIAVVVLLAISSVSLCGATSQNDFITWLSGKTLVVKKRPFPLPDIKVKIDASKIENIKTVNKARNGGPINLITTHNIDFVYRYDGNQLPCNAIITTSQKTILGDEKLENVIVSIK
jgi:hypothetical protein